MKKKSLLKIVTGITLIIVIICVSVLIHNANVKKYNKKFPETYISKHYPNATIITENLAHSKKPNVVCYDNEKHMLFIQEFKKGKGGKYVAKNGKNKNSYDEQIAFRDICDDLFDFIQNNSKKEILNFYGISGTNADGIYVVTSKSNGNEMLFTTIVDMTKDINDEKGYYIPSVFILCDDDIFEEFKNINIDELYKQVNPESGINYFDNVFDGKFTTEESTSQTITVVCSEPNSTGLSYKTYYF